MKVEEKLERFKSAFLEITVFCKENDAPLPIEDVNRVASAFSEIRDFRPSTIISCVEDCIQRKKIQLDMASKASVIFSYWRYLCDKRWDMMSLSMTNREIRSLIEATIILFSLDASLDTDDTPISFENIPNPPSELSLKDSEKKNYGIVYNEIVDFYRKNDIQLSHLAFVETILFLIYNKPRYHSWVGFVLLALVAAIFIILYLGR
jgi:hypothetical protein